MDSFELNKILGALLGTCLILLSLNIVAGALFAPPHPAKPGYEIAVPEKGAAPAEGAPKEAEQPIEALLANANIQQGETAAKKCAACHTFNKGGPNRVGPNLWGVVGRKIASVAGFNYSSAMKGMQGEWTVLKLNDYLLNPKGMVPGTIMTFAGLPRSTERANMLAYLNSLSDSPQPLPKAAAAPPAPAPKEAAAPASSAPAATKPAPAGAAPAQPAPKAAESAPAPSAPPALPAVTAPPPAAPASSAPAAAPPPSAPDARAPSAPPGAAPAETKPPQ
jgi:cytochrome c